MPNFSNLSNDMLSVILVIMPSTSEKKQTDRPEFIFVGEHPAIDFANTLVASHGDLEDLLRSWSDVVDWLSRRGLSADPSLNLPASRGVEALKSAVELRRAWKAELARLISGGKVSDEFLERLNTILAEDSFHETLHRKARRAFTLSAHSLTFTEKSSLSPFLLARSPSSWLRRT